MGRHGAVRGVFVTDRGPDGRPASPDASIASPRMCKGLSGDEFQTAEDDGGAL